jgi:hypothetical protein
MHDCFGILFNHVRSPLKVLLLLAVLLLNLDPNGTLVSLCACG